TEAIAMAKESNLVCEGTAFIGWDESEKVQVSTREIYQPAMEVRDVAVGRFVGKAKSAAIGGAGKMMNFAGGIDKFLGRSFGGSQPPLDGGFLGAGIEERSPDWEDAVGQDPVFQGVGGAEFFKTLQDWLMATGHLKETAKARQELVQLLND